MVKLWMMICVKEAVTRNSSWRESVDVLECG